MFQEPSMLPNEITDPSTKNQCEISSKGLEPPLLLTGMATCHSLTIIDGVLNGDPLDLKVRFDYDQESRKLNP